MTNQLRYRQVKTSEKVWISIWGPKSKVVEKRLFPKEDGLPISVVIQQYPEGKDILNKNGYKLHSHEAVEVGYVVKGLCTTRFDGIGDIELAGGTLFCNPAGTKHGVTDVSKETEIILYYYPPYNKPEGLVEDAKILPDFKGEFRIIRAQDRDWIHAWGTKTNVREKRYLAKEDGFPFSFLLRSIPVQKRVVSSEGYKFHSHPALEVGYVLEGGIVVAVEGMPDHDFAKGTIVCNPAGTKHAAIEAPADTMIAVVNIPPFGRNPAVVDKPGAPEEG